MKRAHSQKEEWFNDRFIESVLIREKTDFLSHLYRLWACT